MSQKRKEEIILATLYLASKNGLKAISMQMIADQVGIKKASLYNHFSSKEELVKEMYIFIRNRSKAQIPVFQPQLLYHLSAEEILSTAVFNYVKMTSLPEITMFYKVLYSEQAFNPLAASILLEETNKMIEATQQLLSLLEEKELLHFSSLERSAETFALTIHALMDIRAHECFISGEENKKDDSKLHRYIQWFVKENQKKEVK